jgi:2-keto-3-deoxy-galactonokinase
VELCDAINGLNLTKDQEIDDLRKELRGIVLGLDVKDLRKDTGAREVVKQDLDDLLSKFSL